MVGLEECSLPKDAIFECQANEIEKMFQIMHGELFSLDYTCHIFTAFLLRPFLIISYGGSAVAADGA